MAKVVKNDHNKYLENSYYGLHENASAKINFNIIKALLILQSEAIVVSRPPI